MTDRAHYKITGVTPGRPPGSRKEFSAWSQDPKNAIQVSLFIRALQKFYEISYTETLSYFQIAGIHGWPGNMPWDNSDPPPYDDGSDNPPEEHRHIYCTHNLVTFPTWHRCYMLLFEQRVWELMGDVIKSLEFPNEEEKAKWVEAKDQWRLPYWDWAIPKQFQIPALFTASQIKIQNPKGGSDLITENPLARYQLKIDGTAVDMGSEKLGPYKIIDDAGFPWSKCSGTSRWGINNKDPPSVWSAGVNNYDGTNQAIAIHNYYLLKNWPKDSDILQHPVSDLVYRVLSEGYAKTWDHFATTADHDKSETWDEYLNLEYIHNNLHNFIGGIDMKLGAGHMGDVPVAAFDPVFWMHHCLIDRLAAIFQVLYPDKWFASETTAKEPLQPFHGGDGVRNLTSDEVKERTSFGYEYDVLQYRAGESEEQRRVRVRDYVRTTYGGTGWLLVDDPRNLFDSGEIEQNDYIYNDYVLNVIYDRAALNGQAYTLHFFLGDVSDQEINALTTSVDAHPKHVGSIYTFSSSWGGMDGCPNCRAQRKATRLSTAQVPLTIPLYRRVTPSDPHIEEEGFRPTGLEGFQPDPVEDYLQKNLHWKAIKNDGTIVPMAELGRTIIRAFKGEGQHYPEDHPQFASKTKYFDYSVMPDATRGKPGGE